MHADVLVKLKVRADVIQLFWIEIPKYAYIGPRDWYGDLFKFDFKIWI